MFVCSCFGITEQQVHDHVAAGAGTPREIAARCKAGTDCGSCVRRIQGLLGRGAPCGRRVAASAAAEAVPVGSPAAPLPAHAAA
ncbi:(2Fe-2S)-binding protein [Streptomyces bohaiensis]